MTFAYELEFDIEGTPTQQGSMKPVKPRGQDKTFLIPTNQKALATYREEVRAVIVSLIASTGIPAPWDGPVSLEAVFYFRPPASRKWVEHLVFPDGDKLLRALFDALEKGGIITNDARINKFAGERAYSEEGHSHTHVKLGLSEPMKYKKPAKPRASRSLV